MKDGLRLEISLQRGDNHSFYGFVNKPDKHESYAGTDPYEVRLTLEGQIQDKNFLAFVQKVHKDLGIVFMARDLMVLDAIRQDRKIPPEYRPLLDKLVHNGLVEQIGGRGKNAHYILSKDYYSFIGEKGTYTRKKGLDRATNKALLLRHIEENAEVGSPLIELCQVLPHVSREVIRKMLQELKQEKKIHHQGAKQGRGGRWYPH